MVQGYVVTKLMDKQAYDFFGNAVLKPIVAEREHARRELEKYCGQDTLGMVWIVHELERLI